VRLGLIGGNYSADADGYAASKNGKMLSEAFIIAYNSVVSHAGALAAVETAAPAVEASATYTVGIDTKLHASADANAETVRALRAETK
jgi:hypothetical protein